MASKSHSYRLGSRKSQLALAQATSVHSLLVTNGIASEIIPIESEGDTQLDKPLYEFDDTPGVFIKALERALLDGGIDLAVHSLKDLPTIQPDGLEISCIPHRASAADCLVVRADAFRPPGPFPVREGAVIGTSSLRREAEALSQRPDLRVISIRGNLTTRIQLVREGRVDAVIIAEAGLERLDCELTDLCRFSLPHEVFVSAPGQGALAVETRDDCPVELSSCLRKVHSLLAQVETRIERRILRELEGGCTLPLGVRCWAQTKPLKLNAFLGLVGRVVNDSRTWASFHYFDISDTEEETLVRKTVEFFRGLLGRTRGNGA